MSKFTSAKVRNFTLAGHSGSGKTLLADTMLFNAGKVTRVGKVEDKTSVSDYRQEEQDKGQSLFATPLHCSWKDNELFFVDTPGNLDFQGEACAALSVCDTALIVIDAHSGIEFGTVRTMKMARERGCPRAIFVNGLDRENADYFKILKEIQDNYGATTCIPITLPVGESANFSSVVHVLRGEDVPAELAELVSTYKTTLMDTVAESDEELMMRYLEGEELSEKDISKGLHAAVQAGSLIPVFCGSAARNIGIEQLMNGIVNLFPDPLALGPVALADGSTIQPKEDGDGLGFVFKSVIDPFIGQLTFMRVYTGSITCEGDILNVSRNTRERFGSMLLTNGKEQEALDCAVPGMIVAVPKLKATHINDTLSTNTASHGKLKPIVFPKPTASFACYPVKKGDDDKIATALHRLADEDPTVKVERQEETAELLLYGMGDQHLRLIIDRVHASAHVEVDLRKPKVPYRETITKEGDAKYRHKKQTGGHGQFAEVWLRIEPITEQEYEFANEVVGGHIPKNFIPGVEKGVVDAMKNGPLANCKVINIRAAVYDGKYHPVDSSDMAFQIAGRSAFREAMRSANPILLEPIMHVRITIPPDYMGDISGDLNQRRGRILGMALEDGMQTVEAEVPLGEMHNYSSQLRSLTHGRGSFSMEFIRYDQVPTNVSKQIQEEAAKDSAEEE